MATRVTFAIPTWNQAPYVAAAVRSALAQRLDGLEILISDDASDDGTWEIVQDTVAGYRGPHAVRLNRNPRRLAGAHLNRVMELAGGEILVYAQGDDRWHPERAARVAGMMDQLGAHMVTSNAVLLSPDGMARGLMIAPAPAPVQVTAAEIATKGWTPRLSGATLAWRRSVFDHFGPLDPRLSPFGMDHILPFRAAILGGLWHLPEALVGHRIHPGSATYMMLNKQASAMEHGESTSAHTVTNLNYMLETVLEEIRRHGATPELAALQRQVSTAMLKATRHWIMQRNQLRLRGLRAYWSDNRPTDAAPKGDWHLEPAAPLNAVPAWLE